MENLRSSFRTNCEQIFFALFVTSRAIFFLALLQVLPGWTEFAHGMLVRKIFIARCLAFSRRYTYRFLNSEAKPLGCCVGGTGERGDRFTR